MAGFGLLGWWNGYNQNYMQAFQASYMIQITELFAIIFIPWFLYRISLSVYKLVLQRREKLKIQEVNKSMESSEIKPLIEQKSDPSKQKIREEINNKNSIKILELISDVLLWCWVIVTTFFFGFLAGFNTITTTSAGFIIFFIFMLTLIYEAYRFITPSPPIQNIFKDFYSRINLSYTQYSQTFWGLTIFSIFLAIFIPVSLQGICICVFNEKYGWNMVGDWQFSTQMTRGHWINGVYCSNRSTQICHVYASLPSNTSNSVFINVHTNTIITQLSIKYFESTPNSTIYFAQGILTPIKGLQAAGNRNVFSVLLNNLNSSSLYTINITAIVQEPLQSYTQVSYNYRTLPSQQDLLANPNQTITLVVGGDVGMTGPGQNLTNLIGNFQPDAIIIGGDVAYDDANINCFYSWDTFLNMYTGSMTQSKRLIPFILAVGNHDVGFNSLSGVNISVGESGPLYFSYFPLQFQNEENQTGIMPVESRKSYNHYVIGNSVFLTLDSGYLETYNGTQLEFINNIAQSYSNYAKFAIYHNPTFPICNNINSTNGWGSVNNIHYGVQYWNPLFYQYNFTGVFENHVHQLKVTYPLQNNSVVNETDGGTMFFGDGSWGVNIYTCPENQNMANYYDIFQNYLNENSYHIWLVQMNSTNVNYAAYNTSGNNIFQNNFTQQFSNYFTN